MDNGTRWLVQSLRAGQPVTLFANQRRNPVWAVSLSNALLELAASTFTGVLNIAGAQAMTRAEFGLRMLDWWGVTERASWLSAVVTRSDGLPIADSICLWQSRFADAAAGRRHRACQLSPISVDGVVECGKSAIQ